MKMAKCLECTLKFLTYFLTKTILFTEGIGVYIILVEIPEGWWDYFCVKKLEILGRSGVCEKFPPL